jgi:hypothetical protein
MKQFNDITIFEFAQALCNKDFSYIGCNELEFNDYIADYFEHLNQTDIYKEFANIINSLKFAKLKYLALETATYLEFNDTIKAKLKEIGYHLNDSRSLKIAVKNAKANLDFIQKKYETYNAQNSQTLPKFSDFMQNVAVVSKYMGYGINVKETLLIDYLSCYNLYINYGNRENK